MLCHLPNPYPDEVLYSVIARYLIYCGISKSSTAAAQIFGRKTIPRVEIPSSLEAVAASTSLTWGLTSEEIANQLTLFPFYARYVPEERRQRALEVVRGNNGTGIQGRFGLSTSRLKAPRFLRFCKECRESDISTYGETYWRRSHQLGGTLVCHEHGSPLLNSKAFLKPLGLRDYVDATLATEIEAVGESIKLAEKDRVNAIKVAKRSNEMLCGIVNEWQGEDMAQVYRKAALDRGYHTGATTLDQVRLEKDLLCIYGEEFFKILGIDHGVGTSNSWIRNIFRPRHRKSFHSALHAIIQLFLEDVPVDHSKSPLGFGPWRCPNQYFTHENDWPIEALSDFTYVDGILVATAKCSCGISFTFSETFDDDRSRPVVRKITKYPPSWVEKAEDLRKSGLTVREIAKKMNVAHETAKKFLNGNYPSTQPNSITPEEIQSLRTEWMALLDKVENRRRGLAKKLNLALYAKLRRHDREWLYSGTWNRNENRNSNVERVNWKDRDLQWSLELEQAAKGLVESGSKNQITRTGIVKNAGLSFYMLEKKKNFLPKCHHTLEKYSETLEDWKYRRIEAAAKKRIEMGKKPTRSFLKGSSGREQKMLSPRLEELIESLVR